MNNDQLNYLIDIAATKSMTATAANFYCSQQAVSESIRKLEEELNCQLLIRTNKGVQFTEAGKRVLTFAIDLKKDYTTLQNDVFLIENEKSLEGTLRIGIVPMAAAAFMKNLLVQINRAYPHMKLVMWEATVDTIIKYLMEDKIDFAIFGHYEIPDDEQLVEEYRKSLAFHKLYTDELVAVMSAHNPLAQKDYYYDEELQGYPYTAYNHVGVDSYLQDENCMHISNQTEVHQYFMTERNTYCRMPHHGYLSRYQAQGFVAKHILDLPPITVYLARKREAPPEKQAILSMLVQSVVQATVFSI